MPVGKRLLLAVPGAPGAAMRYQYLDALVRRGAAGVLAGRAPVCYRARREHAIAGMRKCVQMLGENWPVSDNVAKNVLEVAGLM